MKKTASSFTHPLFILGLAALGQFFIVQRENHFSLWPGLLFYGVASALFLRLVKAPVKPQGPLAPRQEVVLFTLILALAAFFRLYHLDQFPAGILQDEACEGWGALRILNEGWRPFYEVYHMSVWDPPLYYLLAGWFKFVPLSQFNFFLFFVLFSLATFPLLYWVFRQLAGPRAALTALFLLSVMRWDVTYSRDGHPAIQILFYMAGALGFWLYALRTGKRWPLLVGAVFFAGGFYVYQAYKAFLLLMPLFLLYEARKRKGPFVRNALLWFFLPALVLSSPIWGYWIKSGSLGPREEELLIFPNIFPNQGLVALLHHLGETLLMFNRQGDPWFLHNIPYHRMLDDGTGLFLVLGVALAVLKWKETKFFYALAGLGVMVLPSFLSRNAAHGSRAFGTVPFTALLAALALAVLLEKLPGQKKFARLALAAALSFVAWQNFKAYFVEQAGNYECWRGPATDATRVGKAISETGGRDEVYLSSSFFGSYDVEFLGYYQKDHVHSLDLPGWLALPEWRPGQGVLFALQEGQTGVLQLLQELYPGGEAEKPLDPWGHPYVYFYRVPPEAVPAGIERAEKFMTSGFGLIGAYRDATNWGVIDTPLYHPDLLINFTFRNDFPFPDFPPLSVRWSGSLMAPATGSYRFIALTTDSAQLSLDGKPVFAEGNKDSAPILLKKGLHRLELTFEKATGTDTALSLLWWKPGDTKYEVIPARAYRTRR